MLVRLRVKEVAREKGIGIGKLQRNADVAYNTVKRMFKDPYYITTTETLGKIAKKGRRFTFSANRRSSSQRASSMEPENLAVYVRRAEKEVLPIIKEMQLGPGAAQFLLAQQTQVLVTGDPRLTVESGMAIANNVLELWQEGY
jgi:hypothetical protein